LIQAIFLVEKLKILPPKILVKFDEVKRAQSQEVKTGYEWLYKGRSCHWISFEVK